MEPPEELRNCLYQRANKSRLVLVCFADGPSCEEDLSAGEVRPELNCLYMDEADQKTDMELLAGADESAMRTYC